jgi:hypothetical protein
VRKDNNYRSISSVIMAPRAESKAGEPSRTGEPAQSTTGEPAPVPLKRTWTESSDLSEMGDDPSKKDYRDYRVRKSSLIG